MIQHHNAARRVVVSLSCFAYHKIFRLLPTRGLMGSQRLKRTIKKNTPKVDGCAEMQFQTKISDLSVSTNPKKACFSSNAIFKLHPSNSIFKLQSSNSIFKLHTSNSIFKLHSSNSIFKLQSSSASFAILFNFKLLKTC